MKKLVTIIPLILFFLKSTSQTLVFHENMENIDSLTSTGSPAWTSNSRLQVSGLYSDSCSVDSSSTSILETNSMNLTGYTYVVLSFKHICKISFFDQAIVEVYNGTSWVQLTAQDMMPGQSDSATFDGQGNNFSEAIYIDWFPGQNITPDNSWWKTEIFDISSIVSNITNAKVRWKLADQNFPGGDGKAGWFIDDITVLAAPCELIPPYMTQFPPVIQNSVLSLGPYTLNVYITDASGIDTSSAVIIYTINGGAPQTVSMNYISGHIFSGTIPAVNDSDTICYYFYARDNSSCHNPTQYPATGCISFIAYSSLVIPFCDNFDLNNFWTDSTVTGSSWQYGTPTVSPAAAHSAPNCWEVALGAPYVLNTKCYLVSPDISFINIYNASVNFWYYSDCFNQYDGARMEYSTDFGVTWTILGTCTDVLPVASNWYNNCSLFSSTLPGWTGNSGAWINAKHNVSMLDNTPLARFRYVFTSSNFNSMGNGFGIDDFCITVPQPYDAGVLAIVQPYVQAPVGDCVPVIATISNFGSQTISNFNIVYTVNGTVGGTLLHTNSLAPGASVNDTILPCFTVPAGQTQVCVYTSLSNDSFHFNDTICTTITGVQTFAINDSVSYCDSFDGINNGWVSQYIAPVNTSTTWELGTPAYGATNNALSAPNSWDVNLTTNYNNSANVGLYSPFFSINSIYAHIGFSLNYNTEQNWDGTRLDYSNDGGLTWHILGILNDPLGVNWYNQHIISSNMDAWAGNSAGWKYSEYTNLASLNGQVVQFRFVFTSDASIFIDGCSMDDFCLFVPQVNGAAAISVNATAANPLIAPGQCVSFRSVAKNTGVSPMTSLIQTILIDGTILDIDTVNYSPGIAHNANAPSHIFSNCWTATAGIHTVCFITKYPNNASDIITSDDTICISLNIQPSVTVNSANPYCTDFESGQPWQTFNSITYSNQTSWQLGSPTKTILNNSYSGVNSWVTNLTQNYSSLERSALFTPYFSIYTNTTYKISFYTRFKTEAFQDGGTVEYSTDNGTTWTVLGNSTNPQWMNSSSITALNNLPQIVPGWSGANATWVNMEHLICIPSPAGTIAASLLFRFNFASDFSIQDEGWQIDDFCFKQDTAVCVVGISEVENNSMLELKQNIPNPFSRNTYIDYILPGKGKVKLSITDIAGREVYIPVDAVQEKGIYRIIVDASILKAGIYYYFLKFEEKTIVKKMLVE